MGSAFILIQFQGCFDFLLPFFDDLWIINQCAVQYPGIKVFSDVYFLVEFWFYSTLQTAGMGLFNFFCVC
jgi:hypothetical protein